MRTKVEWELAVGQDLRSYDELDMYDAKDKAYAQYCLFNVYVIDLTKQCQVIVNEIASITNSRRMAALSDMSFFSALLMLAADKRAASWDIYDRHSLKIARSHKL